MRFIEIYKDRERENVLVCEWERYRGDGERNKERKREGERGR